MTVGSSGMLEMRPPSFMERFDHRTPGKCFEAFYVSTDTKSDFGAEQSGQVQSSGT